METTPNVHEWMYFHTVECYSSQKETKYYTCNNMGEPQKIFTKLKQPPTEGHILYDSVHMKQPE